ncbi:MAG: hypothetical protein ACE5DM_00740 [Candidatus Nanoarchaeia archaeon]
MLVYGEYQWFQAIIYPIIDVLAILAVVFAVKSLIKIKRQHKMPEAKKMLSRVFLLFSIGLILWVVAELGWDIWAFTAGETPGISFLDILWAAGYFFTIPAFLIFTTFILKKHKNLKKGLLGVGAAALVTAVMTFVLVAFIIAQGIEDASGLELFIYFFYPIASVLMVVSASSVYLFFRQIKPLSLPLLLLALGTLASFFGDTLFTYYDWNGIYGWAGALSDIFYAMDYGLWAVAFYTFSNKLEGKR